MIKKIIFAIILINYSTGVAFSQTNQTREIVITADAWGHASPDTAVVTILVETTGKTAQLSRDAGEKIVSDIKNKLNSDLGNGVTVSRRDIKYSGANPGSPMSEKAVIRMRRFIGVTTSNIEKVPQIIDTALAQGASEITAVELSVQNANQSVNQTIELATQRTKEKAEILAKSLGVKLGGIIDATITEDPAGKMIRLDQQRGQTLALSDQNIHVYVNARFEIENPSTK